MSRMVLFFYLEVKDLWKTPINIVGQGVHMVVCQYRNWISNCLLASVLTAGSPTEGR